MYLPIPPEVLSDAYVGLMSGLYAASNAFGVQGREKKGQRTDTAKEHGDISKLLNHGTYRRGRGSLCTFLQLKPALAHAGASCDALATITASGPISTLQKGNRVAGCNVIYEMVNGSKNILI